LRDELGRLGSQVEWGVKIYVDSAESDDGRTDPPLGGTGGDYLNSRRRSRERAANERSRLNDLVAQVDRSVSVLSTAEVVRPARSTGAGAPVFCASYLVSIPDEERFLGTLDNLQQTLSAQGIRIERTGPWPPYDFVTVHLDEPVVTLGETS
jgi:hypothetical protein